MMGPRVICTLETLEDDMAPTTGVGFIGTRIPSRATPKKLWCTTAREWLVERTWPACEYHFDASAIEFENRRDPASRNSDYGGVDAAPEAVGLEEIPCSVRERVCFNVTAITAVSHDKF